MVTGKTAVAVSKSLNRTSDVGLVGGSTIEEREHVPSGTHIGFL